MICKFPYDISFLFNLICIISNYIQQFKIIFIHIFINIKPYSFNFFIPSSSFLLFLIIFYLSSLYISSLSYTLSTYPNSSITQLYIHTYILLFSFNPNSQHSLHSLPIIIYYYISQYYISYSQIIIDLSLDIINGFFPYYNIYPSYRLNITSKS